jgi:hypothetical protein
MTIRALLTTGAFCAALGLFGGAVYAQSASTIEDATIKADEAAEAEAKAAEAVAEGQAKKLQEEAEIEQDAVRGEPMQEVEVYGED